MPGFGESDMSYAPAAVIVLKMFEIMRNAASGTWEEAEAALFVVTAVAHNILPYVLTYAAVPFYSSGAGPFLALPSSLFTRLPQ